MLIITLFAFIFGAVFGSFTNVLIFRVPKHEEFIKTRSHCMTCGHILKWYELIPIISWLALRGKCKSCKAQISPQYPIVEAAGGLLWAVVFVAFGAQALTILTQALFTTLLTLSIMDERTHEIPAGFNVFIGILGLIVAGLDSFGLLHEVGYMTVASFDRAALLDHVIGLFAMSIPLYIIFLVSGGRAMGGGDIKLMAAAGLFLGWKNIIFAFFLGCIIGAVIHLIRMRFFGKGREMAMGPYLSAGIAVAVMYGDQIINWYFSLLGF